MIEVTNYKAINKGSLLGTLSIKIPMWHMFINDLALFQKDGKRWISMPSRQYEDNGEKKYFPYVGFTDGVTYDRFSTSCLKALDDYMVKLAKEQEARGEVK